MHAIYVEKLVVAACMRGVRRKKKQEHTYYVYHPMAWEMMEFQTGASEETAELAPL